MRSTRRNFIKLSGCLTIGFYIGPLNGVSAKPFFQGIPESLKRNPNINSWIEILADGRIRVFTGKLELGQGVKTAIAQVAAEELDHDINKVEVVIADTARTPNEGYTAGSGSMEYSAMAVRYAAAAAKAKLIELAAVKLNVATNQLSITNGVVQTKTGGRSISFAALLNGKQITDKVSESVSLKPKGQYKISGKPVLRNDIKQMVLAESLYVQDLRFPGMVHARIVRPPAYTANLEKIDEEYINNNSRILKLIRNGNFIGVIAEDEYEAVKAQQTVRWACTWKQENLPDGADVNLKKYISQLPVKSEPVHEAGSLTSNQFTHTSQYFKPYIMHGSIGPSCAVAIYKNDKLHIWSHSQGVFPLREAIAKMLKLSEDNITITGVPGAGCYGHNGADDVAADAAILAIQYPGKHVRLQWSREDEHLWEPYGSAMIMEVSANINTTGKVTDWKYQVWSDNHSTRPGGNAGNLLAARYISNPFDPPSGGYSGGAYRNSQPYYNFPNQQVYAHIFKGPLRVSALRSLGAYANIFAIESFMDELAEKAGVDPYEFRIRQSTDDRAIAVIKKLRELTKNEKLSEGMGIGIAFSRYKNSAAYCAVAAMVKIDTSAKKIRVLKMWATIDAGEVINPDGLINQTEGGLIQAASWTLMEEVKFDNKHVTSADWNVYPIMRFADIPEVHVEIIMRQKEEVLGAGEAAQGPAAAALANAVYYASGKRMRDLPIRLKDDG